MFLEIKNPWVAIRAKEQNLFSPSFIHASSCHFQPSSSQFSDNCLVYQDRKWEMLKPSTKSLHPGLRPKYHLFQEEGRMGKKSFVDLHYVFWGMPNSDFVQKQGKGKFCYKNACKVGWGLPIREQIDKIFIIKQLALLYVVVVFLK